MRGAHHCTAHVSRLLRQNSVQGWRFTTGGTGEVQYRVCASMCIGCVCVRMCVHCIGVRTCVCVCVSAEVVEHVCALRRRLQLLTLTPLPLQSSSF